MYSQATHSLVGTTFDNRTLNSYREGLSNATELSVDSADELLDIFTTYHFNPTPITDQFTLLAETATELEDIYTSLYKYSYANPHTVSVTRESVTEYTTWNSLHDYLEETYNRLFAILDNADQYDISTTDLTHRLEHLARTLYVYTAVTRTALLTNFKIRTQNTPEFTFVELPEALHTELYPAWYLANSLGVLPSLTKPTDTSYTPPEELPPAFHTTRLPETHTIKQNAKNHNYLTTLTASQDPQAVNAPLQYFTDAPDQENRPRRYAQTLIDAYHTELADPAKPNLAAD